MLLKLIGRYTKPYLGAVWVVVGMQFIASIASLLLPSINADLINQGVVPGDTRFIITQGGWMLLVSLVQVLTTIAAVYFGSRTAMFFGRDVRSGIFRRVHEFSSREVAFFGAPSLITRNTNDVQQVQMLLQMSFTMLVTTPITMIGGVVIAVREDPGLAWLVAVAVPLLGICIGLIAAQMLPGFRLMQTRIDRVNQVLREQITGIRVIRAFVREPHEDARFRVANAELTDVSIRVGRWMVMLFPIVMLVLNASSVAVIWFGGLRVDAGLMEIGSLTAYISYLIQILIAVMMSTMLLMMLPRASVSAERIMEVLNTATTVVAPEQGKNAPVGRNNLQFEHVSFNYPGAEQPVLHDLNFTASPGQTVAIIGATGSGKSTLISLVPRLMDTTEGRVLIGGVDVRELDPDVLWSLIGLVPQKAYLFSGTVRSNLQYGKPDASEEELWSALEVAQASGFVQALPDGLDSPVAQGGTNLSGGQRQRLAIARALVRKPQIFVFDDSFSALDVATDQRLRQALKPVTRDAVVLIVAQRVATIMDADYILVIEDGRIVGRGTHGELLGTSETYREIVASQELVAA